MTSHIFTTFFEQPKKKLPQKLSIIHLIVITIFHHWTYSNYVRDKQTFYFTSSSFHSSPSLFLFCFSFSPVHTIGGEKRRKKYIIEMLNENLHSHLNIHVNYQYLYTSMERCRKNGLRVVKGIVCRSFASLVCMYML